MTIFDILTDIIKNKTGKLYLQADFEKTYNPYMVDRYLSMRKDLVKYADFLNKYSKNMTHTNQYFYLVDNVPRSSNPFIKYIKKTKDKPNAETKGIDS